TNRPEFVEVALAANAIGAIGVPMNFRLAPDEAAYILGHSAAKVVVTDTMLAPLAKAATAAADPAPSLTVVAGAESGDGAVGYESLAATSAELAQIYVDERDVALIMYTSGTTGRPKGAMLTHLNLLMQSVTAIRVGRSYGDDTVGLVNVPLFHIAGI